MANLQSDSTRSPAEAPSTSPGQDGRSGRTQLLRYALVIGGLVVAAKFFAALREIVIAWRYGVSALVDSYQISFMIVTWVPILLTTIVITALVPNLVVARRGAEHRLFVSELNGAALALGLVTLAVAALLGPYLAGRVALPLGAPTAAMSRDLTLLLAPFAFLLVLSGYLGVRLQAIQSYGYTVLEALPALGLCLLVLAFSEGDEYWPLAAGLLIGGALQLGLLAMLVRRFDGSVGAVRFRFASAHWRSTFAALGAIALGQVFHSLSIPIDQILAAELGTGAVATIGYSNRLIGLITSLCITVIGYSLLPFLSGLAARGEVSAGRARSLRSAGLLFALGWVVAGAGWALAPWGIELVFERGAFTAEDTRIVSEIFRISLLQIPFFASGIALMQWLAASHRHGLICLVLLAVACAKLLAALLLADRFGLIGLAMSQVVMGIFLMLGMLLFVLRAAPVRPATEND